MALPNGNSSGPKMPLYDAPTWQAGEFGPHLASSIKNTASAAVAARKAHKKGLASDARRANQKKKEAPDEQISSKKTAPAPATSPTNAVGAAPVRPALSAGNPANASSSNETPIFKGGMARTTHRQTAGKSSVSRQQFGQRLAPAFINLTRVPNAAINAAPQPSVTGGKPQLAITSGTTHTPAASAYKGAHTSSPRLPAANSAYKGDAPSSAPYSTPSSQSAIKDSTKIKPLGA